VIWLFLLAWFIFEAIFFSIAVILGFMLLLAGLAALGIMGVSYKITGRWPSDRAVIGVSGTVITLWMAAATQDRWVLLGGIIGTVIASKTAAE
jgi:hypothetical protein